MIELSFMLLFVGLIVCFVDLQAGMYATLFAGFLQDPLRKSFVDQPVYFSTLVILFAFVTFIGAKMREGVLPFGAIPGWNERMLVPIQVFVVVVIFQSFASVAYTGSIIIGGIGLAAYLSPFPAFMLAYSFASSGTRVRTFLWFYVAFCAAMVTGVYLSWLGVDWDILTSVGDPLTIYLETTGEAVDLPPGFFRAPEVAAWHAAAGFSFSIILGLASRRFSGRWASGALALFFMGAVFLTGRRKFLVEMLIFLPILLILLMRFKAGSGRLIGTMAVVTIVGVGMASAGLITSQTGYSMAEVAARRDQQYLGDELWDRVVNVTVGSFEYVLDRNGFFGSGAGSGSQGAQYFGGGDEIIGSAAEGGLGKILAELGVPGILALVWIGFSFVGYLWKTLDALPQGDQSSTQTTLGLTAFVIVNGIVFTSAHQVFGDLFVLLLIGTCMGFVVASQRFAAEASFPDATTMDHGFGHPGRAGGVSHFHR